MDWPGNVRELEHALERAMVLSRRGPITTDVLSLTAALQSAGDPFDSLSLEEGMHATVAKLERRLVERALAQAAGNRTRAAEILKINRRLLYDKLREFQLE
jgi:DNA-binding NtrC family response regulator